uniref:Uncharacterized protein n=1 Tax=Romanomermis culicivorax TaxID=13658 RepID=A0A915KF50_ROMCU
MVHCERLLIYHQKIIASL